MPPTYTANATLKTHPVRSTDEPSITNGSNPVTWRTRAIFRYRGSGYAGETSQKP